MGILLTLAVQTSLAMNWGGRMQGLVEHVITDSGKALNLIEQHIVTAGPVREAIPRLDRDLDSLQKQMNECSNRQSLVIQRLEQIEARNKIADSNWDKLKTKGFLVDRPNQTRSER
jgi:phage shock protein A